MPRPGSTRVQRRVRSSTLSGRLARWSRLRSARLRAGGGVGEPLNISNASLEQIHMCLKDGVDRWRALALACFSHELTHCNRLHPQPRNVSQHRNPT